MILTLGRPGGPAGPTAGPTPSIEGPGRFVPVVAGPALAHGQVELDPGGALCWPAAHGEEALVVLAGSVRCAGRTVPTGGAVVLHGGGPLRLEAPEGARLAHFWSDEGRREGSAPAEVHLLGPGGRARSEAPGGSQAVWYADSTCPGCRVTLMKVGRDAPDHRGRAHAHTADEVIAVVHGEVAFGAHRLEVGAAAHLPAGMRYAVTSGPHGHAFLNFRAGPSEQTYADDGRPQAEHAAARGGVEVGDVIA